MFGAGCNPTQSHGGELNTSLALTIASIMSFFLGAGDTVCWLVGWLPLFNILNNYGITSFNTHAMNNPSLHLPSPHLRTHVNILSAPLEPSGSCSNFERLRGASSLDQAFRARQRSQKCWQVRCLRAARPINFERPGGDERPASSGVTGASSGAEGARAAISNAPAEPGWLDVGNVGGCGVFESADRVN